MKHVPWVLALLVAVEASAMRIQMSRAAVVLQGDVVIAAKVVQVGAPKEGTIKTAHGERRGLFRQQTVEVTDVWYDPSGKVKVGEQLTFTSQAPKPPPPPQAVQGPNGQVVVQMAPVMMDGPTYPNLTVKSEYGLVLKRLPGDQGLMLESSPEYFVPKARAEAFERLRLAAGVDSWSWGEEVQGLRLAVVPDNAELRVSATRRGGQGQPKEGAWFFGIVAVRNVGEAPLAINLYRGDEFLGFTYQNVANETRHADWYDLVRRRAAPFHAERDTAIIEPGRILAIAAHGANPYGFSQLLETQAGRLTLMATYESKRKAEAVSGERRVPLWQGRVESAEVQLEAVPR